ncbi:MAG: ThuA domain-containing protein [Saprospiraceae bacterium]
MKVFVSCLILFLAIPAIGQNKLKALIIDGQNNHVVWPKSTIMMKQYLEESNLFEVDIQRTQYIWKAEREKDYLPLAETIATENLAEPKTDPDFSPNFANYDVVISNFGWKAAPWSACTQKVFETYVKMGGGFVSVHAADNSFPEWEAYNQMIGIGGWGGRDEKNGPYVYYNEADKLVVDSTQGNAGAHGERHQFQVRLRDSNHPITAGMPQTWWTGVDECYAKLRGPAQDMTVLATAKDLSKKAPTDRHEPILMVIDYGKGRVFHTTLGHDTDAFENVGFITSLLRGVEWAATGKVTQTIPTDFPTTKQSKSRTFQLKEQ